MDTENDMSTPEEVEDREFIDTAIFYSITSTQKGLTVKMVYNFNVGCDVTKLLYFSYRA